MDKKRPMFNYFDQMQTKIVKNNTTEVSERSVSFASSTKCEVDIPRSIVINKCKYEFIMLITEKFYKTIPYHEIVMFMEGGGR